MYRSFRGQEICYRKCLYIHCPTEKDTFTYEHNENNNSWDTYDWQLKSSLSLSCEHEVHDLKILTTAYFMLDTHS